MRTKSALKRLGLLAVLCLAPLANADTLQYVGGGVYPGFGSYYVGPYQVKINGAAAVAGICDDFATSIPGPPSTWEAVRNDITEAGLVGAKYISQGIEKYYQVAYLSQKLLNAVSNAERGYIQYAIWDIFNSGAINTIAAAYRPAAQAYKTDAELHATAADGVGWSVYTPNPLGASQEFLVRTPETSAIVLLSINLSALLGAVFLLRRRSTNV